MSKRQLQMRVVFLMDNLILSFICFQWEIGIRFIGNLEYSINESKYCKIN